MRTGAPTGRRVPRPFQVGARRQTLRTGTVITQAITGQGRWVAASSLLAIGHQAGEALVPVLIGVIIDRAMVGGGTADLLRWIVVLAVVFAGLSTSFRFSARFGERASNQAAHRLRLAVTRRILDPRGGAETGRLPGDLVAVATSDAQRVGAVNMAVTAGFAALAGLAVSAVALLRVSVPLGLLVLLGAPLLLWLAHLLGRPLERRSRAEQDRAAYASGVAADLVAGLRVLKGLGAGPAAADRYRRTSRDSLTATVRAAGARAWHDGALLGLTGLFVAAVALLGGRLAANGDIGVGALIAAVGLAQFQLGPLSIFAWVNGEVARARASAGRVASVLAAPPSVEGGSGAPTQVHGHLRLRDVSSGTLRAVSLHASPGELLGVVTTEPACAADLLRCVAREVDPVTGTVELDDLALSTMDPDRLRAAILVAPHDADLFEGSLLDNVTPVTGDAALPPPLSPSDSTAVPSALAAAAADEVAGSLPQGLDTPLTERGRSLSGGQRQRVALARALAAAPPVLVLHDPTTAVDAVTEARIAAGIRELRRGRTTLLVTTSPALLATTDRVVVIDDGAVIAEGSHTDLVRNNDGYRSTVLT